VIEEYAEDQVSTEFIDAEEIDPGEIDAGQDVSESVTTDDAIQAVGEEDIAAQTGEADVEVAAGDALDESEEVEAHEITAVINHVNAPQLYEAIGVILPKGIEAEEAPPAKVYAGNEIVLEVRVTCSQDCDLTGEIVELMAENDLLAELELSAYRIDENGKVILIDEVTEDDEVATDAEAVEDSENVEAVEASEDIEAVEDGEASENAEAIEAVDASEAVEANGTDENAEAVEDSDSSENADADENSEVAETWVYQTATITFIAPMEPGQYTWTALFKPSEEDSLHEPVSATLVLDIEAHFTSLTAWDMPFPVIAGEKFTLKAGVRCVGNCNLSGEQIKLFDQEGELLATGILGEEPKKDTVGLFWTEIEVEAPGELGVYNWELKFAELKNEHSHDEANHAIVFRTALPPEHLLTIELISDLEQIPVVDANATINTGGVYYRCRTNSAGIATFNVPAGEYKLHATAEDHQALDPEEKILVDSDKTVRVEMMYFYDSYK
jgi:hypothetical protein